MLGEKNVVGVIGDSTFVHSGITGLINAAYNGVKGVLIILDNGTTAMTGSQPHPATGRTIKNRETKRLSLEAVCRAAGADNVEVVNPYRTEELESLVKRHLNEDKLSVVITRFPCRIIERRKSAAPSYIADKCTKCAVCLGIDCPAIRKRADGLIELDTALCAGCNLCVEVCKFGALKKT